MSDAQQATEPLLPHATSARKSKKVVVFIVCAVLLLAVDFGFYMSNAPQLAVFEDIICRNYKETLHRTGDALTPSLVEGNPCKSEAVQGELALVIGYKDTFDVLPGLLLSLPYGVLSDRYGRRPFLYLGLLGIVLGEVWVRLVCLWSNVIPLRMVWLSALFKVIGGGDVVITAIALVIVADVFSEDERSTKLFQLQSCIFVAEILAAPLSAYLMTKGPMFPYLLSLGLILVGSIPAIFLPETLEDAIAKRTKQAEPDQHGPVEPQESDKRTLIKELIRQAREFGDSTRFIWSDLNVCLMVLVLFVTVMSRQCTNLLLQYVSAKFDWSIGRSSLLISLRGIFALVTYLLLMPAVTFLAAKYLNLHGKRSDHIMSKGSGILSVIGFIAVFIGPNPAFLIGGLVILSIGSAFMVTTRSLATSLVLPDHVGTLYSAIGIAQGVGLLVSGPLFANLFRLGLHLGKAWMGLPFLMAAVFFFFAVVAVWNVKFEQSRATDEEQEPLLS
ncbi:uncharacterized protein MYU51_005157 [Penicillium brevicompactum]|uniref:uncharacterized protein n=1 Tax=Penicillium brevicompactum TaxID=5074 RepID=UPI00254126C7|nr:uncharacterized protein N7506_006858 [Penicillium brevicompactum]KAJ5333075.1 hypothetical protein N7506_006858 [Penicillium brevicompactum]